MITIKNAMECIAEMHTTEAGLATAICENINNRHYFTTESGGIKASEMVIDYKNDVITFPHVYTMVFRPFFLHPKRFDNGKVIHTILLSLIKWEDENNKPIPSCCWK